jgi:hypothetical protein
LKLAVILIFRERMPLYFVTMEEEVVASVAGVSVAATMTLRTHGLHSCRQMSSKLLASMSVAEAAIFMARLAGQHQQ